jgi:tetratricopeptide (TPR) repeat protein
MNFIPATVALLIATTVFPETAAAEPERRESGAKAVIGTRNPDLLNGAKKLLSGEVEEGIRLTRLGLDVAFGSRERQAGLSNLCAGYLRLENLEQALHYCNQALEINPRNWRALSNRALVFIFQEKYRAADDDLTLAEEVAPNSTALKKARSIYRDATEPVVPTIEIDDRRAPDAT